MHQKIDLPFQRMLKNVRKEKFDFWDVQTLNQRLAIDLLATIVMDTIIII